MGLRDRRRHITVHDAGAVAHCRESLARYKVPDHSCIRAARPLTNGGKVQKFRLVEEVLAGRSLSRSRS